LRDPSGGSLLDFKALLFPEFEGAIEDLNILEIKDTQHPIASTSANLVIVSIANYSIIDTYVIFFHDLDHFLFGWKHLG